MTRVFSPLHSSKEPGHAAMARPGGFFGRGLAGACVYAANEHLVHRSPDRTARSALFGFVFFGPACQAYYPLVDRLCSGPLQKMALDQTAWSGVWNTAYFACHDRDLSRCLANGAAATRQGWAVWPAVHAVTYTLVPVRARAAWVLACDAVWIHHVSRMAKR